MAIKLKKSKKEKTRKKELKRVSRIKVSAIIEIEAKDYDELLRKAKKGDFRIKAKIEKVMI